MKRPELLVPASSLEVLKVAVIYGADAVYIGGEAFGLRAKAKNFSKEDMCEGIAFAHSHGVKVYVTVNILAHNRDLEGVREYLQELKEIGPDALIIADPGIFMYAKEICPEIERHISTQANNTNYETYRFWYNLGAKRVVSARELSLEEIREIRCWRPSGRIRCAEPVNSCEIWTTISASRRVLMVTVSSDCRKRWGWMMKPSTSWRATWILRNTVRTAWKTTA